MDDTEIVSRIMDKAAESDRRGLFAGLQAALASVIDVEYGHYSGSGLEQIERALDVGAEYGSPEQLASLEQPSR